MKTAFRTSVLAAIVAPTLVGTAHAQIEEIIVTATRRAETAQSVPISITALSADRLSKAGLDGVRDIAMVTPGLNMEMRSNVFIPYIRGIGAQDTSGGQEASVSIYIDGVYQVSSHAGALSFNNIDRVEVLKGPQGTLFGRNSTGGLIHVITKEPTQETEVFGKVGYGNYNTWRGQFYAGGGITENLTADIALNYLDQGEGWGKNLFNGEDTPTDYDEGIRSKWVWTGDKTKLTFTGDWQNHETGQGDMRIFQPGSVAADGSVHTGGFYDVNHNWPIGTNLPSNLPNTGSPVATSYVKNWGLTLKVDHEMDWANFVSITARRELEQFNTFDNDGLPISLVDAQQDVNETETFTQEFQLLSNGEGDLNWIVGAFFLDDTSGYGGENGLVIFGDQVVPIPGAYVSFRDPIDTQSMAAFAEVTYDITDATSIVVGARLTKETKEITGRQDVYFPAGIFGPAPFILTTYFDETFEAANGVDLEETWTEPTFKISLNHNLTEDVMVYGSYNRGFRSGSYNTVGVTGVPVEPELIDAYEIGLKSEFLDNRVRFNGAVFFYDFQDLQVVISRGASTDLLNAGKAEVYGFDGELEASINDNLTARLGLSLLETEYTEFAQGNLCSHRGADGRTYGGSSIATAGQECDVTGNNMVRSPEMTFNLGLLYSVPIEYGILGASLDYAWSDEFYWEIDNRLKEPSKGLLNGTVSWQTPDEAFGVTLWGKNIANEKFANFQVAQASCGAACSFNPAGIGDHYSPGAPRTWGVDFGFRF